MLKHLISTMSIALSMYSISANADLITFTGGQVTLNDGSTVVTNNSTSYQDVKHYEESGFRLSFEGATGFGSNIGDYYGQTNDVIHGHWTTGGIGNLNMIKVTKIDGTAFDLNYFSLTSNTITGGGLADGSEQAFIHASNDGVNSSFSQLLPSEDWGFPASAVSLGAKFDNILAFWFVAGTDIDCFGMDNFYINEEAPVTPSSVPVPAAFPLMASALGLGAFGRRKLKEV